jgi:hypothetical protein
VGFDITDQLLIRSFAFYRYWRKKLEYNETVHQRKPVIELVGKFKNRALW